MPVPRRLDPDALEYLNKRGLNYPELIDHFKLGVANRTMARCIN